MFINNNKCLSDDIVCHAYRKSPLYVCVCGSVYMYERERERENMLFNSDPHIPTYLKTPEVMGDVHTSYLINASTFISGLQPKNSRTQTKFGQMKITEPRPQVDRFSPGWQYKPQICYPPLFMLWLFLGIWFWFSFYFICTHAVLFFRGVGGSWSIYYDYVYVYNIVV